MALVSALADPLANVWLALTAVLVLVGFVFVLAQSGGKLSTVSQTVATYAKFCYNCFLKPHKGGSRSQQDALESFYQAQASVYDATRMRLLRGREDMLGLAAAQLKTRVENGTVANKPVWVDVGGGTGYNIEQMAAFVDVQHFFGAVFLVDLSTSLCKVAEERFARLGWKNVKVICQDARHFRLEDHLPQRTPVAVDGKQAAAARAELITMSYSLSMIPEFYPVVDSLATLLAPNGVIGVSDFYVQSEVDYQSRNYTGGEIDRHCMWISRVFWRTWFEADRVSLEAARRDYLEYRFGTILSFNARCHLLGFRIPYYVWVGCSKDNNASQVKLAELNAAVTESPYLSALDLRSKADDDAQRSSAVEIRSKAYESAVINLQASLPLPAPWYQSHHWRIYYDDQLPKHKMFGDEYIYAFTWEDSRMDARLLKIQENDVILAITSAGDNILSYALERPKRIHAVDLNPNQNHLLELKVAALTALEYSDFWKIFGEGKHENFRTLLIEKLSPHLSSLSFQYWLHHGPSVFGKTGLYFTGGSRHALSLAAWLFRIVGITEQVNRMCDAPTLNEQREIWRKSVRKVILSRLLNWTILSSKKWLWKALGVPQNQREMIEHDYNTQEGAQLLAAVDSKHHAEPTPRHTPEIVQYGTGKAIWEYAVNTLEPVVENTLLRDDNYYYLLCLQGKYSQRCAPAYLTAKAHAKLSRPDAFDGLRIHTDEVGEVVERLTPSTLTIAVVMDSMDWFDPKTDAADVQIKKLHRALKPEGRVLLRSAGLTPWYIERFAKLGFSPKRVAVRVPGTCTDRVNMYASTWICTKTSSSSTEKDSPRSSLEPLNIGEAMQKR